jgi:inhibitor of the pro-sigma K processing machinery
MGGSLQMEKEIIMIVGVIICSAILLFVALRKKSEMIMNFVLRGILGTLGMYYVNNFLALQGIYCEVGINPCTVLTSAGLGFPGLLLLYGLKIYHFL